MAEGREVGMYIDVKQKGTRMWSIYTTRENTSAIVLMTQTRSPILHDGVWKHQLYPQSSVGSR